MKAPNAPWVWAGFALAAVIGSVASAGGREVLPRREAVAFPLSSAVDQLGALALVPLNIAWTLQAVMVLGVTAYAVGPSWWLGVALLACWLWILAATALSQLLGWCAEVVRTFRHGVPLLRSLAAAVLAASVVIVWVSDAVDVVTIGLRVVRASITLAEAPVTLTAVLLVLALLAGGAVVISVPVGEVLQRRPSLTESRGETRRHARSRGTGGELAQAVRTDIRSIVRSPPLRRGLLVLLATPVFVALFLPLPWLGIVVLPALVGSGTALLHGVNAVALDGRGALWRESLPQRPDVTLVGRLLALTLLSGGSSAMVVLLASLRAETPSSAEVVATLTAVVVATAQVVSRCAMWSVGRPYAADLRRGRDTPAPPASMAGYSVRLSAATTVGALLIGVGITVERPSLSVGIGAALLLVSALRLRRVFAKHRLLAVRSLVAATVSGG